MFVGISNATEPFLYLYWVNGEKMWNLHEKGLETAIKHQYVRKINGKLELSSAEKG